MSDINFKQLIKDAGIPIEEDVLIDRFHAIAEEEGAPFNNTCAYSPFWRLMSILVARPLVWLLNWQATEILPALFLKTATGDWVDTFAWQFGLGRKPAVKAKGRITLTRSSASGTLTVPAGTVIQSAPIHGHVYRLQTLVAHAFPIGVTELQVVAEATETGSAHNLATGFYALLSTPLAGITGVRNADDWLMTPGADAETDDELKARCRNQFSAINNWHIDAVYKAMVAEYAGIGIDDIYIEHDAPRGPGTANIYILGDTINASADFYEQLTARIYAEETHGCGDDVIVSAMPTQPVSQTVRIRLTGWLDVDAQASLRRQVEQCIRIALRDLPNQAGFVVTPTRPESRFAWSNLIRELHEQFSELTSVDFAHDTDIDIGLWIPRIEQLDVTVTE